MSNGNGLGITWQQALVVVGVQLLTILVRKLSEKLNEKEER